MATEALKRAAVRLEWLGRISYDDAVIVQEEAAATVSARGPESLFLLEHDPVFTLGRNAAREDVLLPAETCGRLGVAIREADRGGRVTYHGPGQLVAYPVLNLDPDRRDVKRYVNDLEEVIIRALGDLGIASARDDRPERVTSVWVGNDKIAAIGVHIARWVTTHGFAINVTNEPLALFAGIVPCGITDGGVTSIERVLGRRVDLAELVPIVARRFAEVFGREIIGG